ncbi:MAG: hypothetical protein ABI068_11555 [Ktedonobacterales bacterium]
MNGRYYGYRIQASFWHSEQLAKTLVLSGRGRKDLVDELREAIDLASQQSEQEQITIAARIKDMIEADQRWEELLSDPDSLSMREVMAEEAHQEYLRAETLLFHQR